jgi:cytochrome c551/c552
MGSLWRAGRQDQRSQRTGKGEFGMIGNTLKVAVLGGLLIVFFSSCGGSRGSAPEGAALFQRERCIYCHRFKEKGGTIGPDLTEVTKRRSDAWIRDQIKDPRSHYSDGAMPPHEYLSKKEIDALIEYLKS